MDNFLPIPPGSGDHRDPALRTIEEYLIQGLMIDGFIYFVQYNNYPSVSINDNRKLAFEWLKSQNIEFKWVGGRAFYELCFKRAEDATMFKLCFG